MPASVEQELNVVMKRCYSLWLLATIIEIHFQSFHVF